MDGCAAEQNIRKVTLADNEDTSPTGKGRPQGGRNVLQGGGSINNNVWFRDVGPFGSHGEEGRRNTHIVPQTDQGEARSAVSIWDVRDARGGRSTGSSGNSVENDLYKETSGNRGTVGGVMATIQSVHKLRKHMKEVDAGGRLGGTNKRLINNFGLPWKKARGSLRGGGDLERASCSRSRRGVGWKDGKS